jgi:hypothetical protein
MKRSLIRWAIALALCASGAALTQAHSESPGLDARIKLTGAELRRFATTYAVYAGVNHENDCAFMLAVYPGGARELFWTCAFRSGASGPGTAHVTWDEVCTQYKWLYAGEPNCWQYYRIAPDKYEAWRESKHVATFTKLK